MNKALIKNELYGKVKGDHRHFAGMVKRQRLGHYLTCINMVNSPIAFSIHPSEEHYPDSSIIFMGLEWEGKPTAPDSAIVTTCLQIKNFRRYMNVRSGGGGLELVTIPATLRNHKEQLESLVFNNNVEDYVGMPSDPYESGIHIHIDKKAFKNALHLRKFIMFVNNPCNRSFMEAIGGRGIQDTGYWCKPNYGRVNCKTHMYYLKSVVVDTRLQQITPSRGFVRGRDIFNTGKGVAVNTQTSYGTVEFRIFKTVNTKQKLFKNLEFTDALVRYTRDAPSKDLIKTKFQEFVLHNTLEYPNLVIDEAWNVD